MKIIKQVIKFSVVGIINTGITIITIFILAKLLNFNYILANIIGYILGLINSFFFNRFWTFKSGGKYANQGVRFIIVFLICYMLQLGMLVLLKEKLSVSADFAQLIGMVFYTCLNFLLSKFYTFKKETVR